MFCATSQTGRNGCNGTACAGALHAYDLARVLCRAAKYAAAKTVAAVISHARADRRQAATVEQWDADIWKLGTPAGTVDLRTGKLSAPSPLDYITKITAVADRKS